MRQPEQGVEENLPLIGIAPVLVRVATGEAHAAATVDALVHPHHGLAPTGGGNDVRVGSWRVDVGAFADGVGRSVFEQPGDRAAVL